MAGARITVRVDRVLLDQLDSYAAAHGLDRAAVVRLALLRQLASAPPRRLPAGVQRPRGNPAIAGQSQAGVEARRAKRRADEDAGA